MSEYIIEWSGIGARITELVGSETLCLAVKHLRKERLREPIVRCRDCTHFMTWTNGYSFCSAFSIGATGEPFPGEPDGFCAWGERRDE